MHDTPEALKLPAVHKVHVVPDGVEPAEQAEASNRMGSGLYSSPESGSGVIGGSDSSNE